MVQVNAVVLDLLVPDECVRRELGVGEKFRVIVLVDDHHSIGETEIRSVLGVLEGLLSNLQGLTTISPDLYLWQTRKEPSRPLGEEVLKLKDAFL